MRLPASREFPVYYFFMQYTFYIGYISGRRMQRFFWGIGWTWGYFVNLVSARGFLVPRTLEGSHCSSLSCSLCISTPPPSLSLARSLSMIQPPSGCPCRPYVSFAMLRRGIKKNTQCILGVEVFPDVSYTRAMRDIYGTAVFVASRVIMYQITAFQSALSR